MCVFFPPSAVELAMIMDRLYGGVCYAGIDTDPELKYPKGAGRVAFSNQQSYIAAISARFVQLQHGEIDKRVSGKKKELSVFRPPLSASFFLHLSHPTAHFLFCLSHTLFTFPPFELCGKREGLTRFCLGVKNAALYKVCLLVENVK